MYTSASANLNEFYKTYVFPIQNAPAPRLYAFWGLILVYTLFRVSVRELKRKHLFIRFLGCQGVYTLNSRKKEDLGILSSETAGRQG